jgi:DNA-binding beta-propeller fold protein YncE
MKALIRIGLPCLFSLQLSVSGFAQSGIITTVARNGIAGFSGDGGPATSAQLYDPAGIAVDSAGNLFIADSFNNRIRKVTGVSFCLRFLPPDGGRGLFDNIIHCN